MKGYKYDIDENFSEYDEIVLPDIGKVLLVSGCSECDEPCANAGKNDLEEMRRALDDVCIAVTADLYSKVDGVVFMRHDPCERAEELLDLLKEKDKRIPVIEVADSWDMEKAAKEIIQEVI